MSECFPIILNGTYTLMPNPSTLPQIFADGRDIIVNHTDTPVVVRADHSYESELVQFILSHIGKVVTWEEAGKVVKIRHHQEVRLGVPE